MGGADRDRRLCPRLSGHDCRGAAGEHEWEEQANGAHFATWQHMGYSLNRATPKDTTRDDIAAAGKEKWWGDPVRVEPIM